MTLIRHSIPPNDPVLRANSADTDGSPVSANLAPRATKIKRWKIVREALEDQA
jgi:hypothetical protein